MRNKVWSFAMTAVLISASAFVPSRQEASAAPSSWHKGASIEPRSETDFSSDGFRQSVGSLAESNANYVSLIIPYYQSDPWSLDIQRGWNTPTDESLASAIQHIHSLGMKVMLKPHLQNHSGHWRAEINPADRDAWYENYGNMLKHYAEIAERYKAESFTMGTELIKMASSNQHPENTQKWTDMINEVRNIYSGQVSYSANWGSPGDPFADEKNHIQFWDKLDFIGMSAYYNLYGDSSVESMRDSWSEYESSDIRPLYERWQKPIVFTEIGYKSVDSSHTRPWDYNLGGSFNESVQANAYEALLSYWQNRDYMQGVHWWHWSSDPNYGGQGNTDYTPQNKQAQRIMASWFSEEGIKAELTADTGCPGPASEAFTACFYSGRGFENFIASETYGAVSFNWDNRPPASQVPPDGFSAAFEGRFAFEANTYNFEVTADDGVRLYVDGNLIIDEWKDQPATTYTASASLSKGIHTVKLEYYENGGNAVAKLSWQEDNGSIEPDVLEPQASAQEEGIVYIEGYPTLNGNYIDCHGNVDNDPAHHTTDPGDQDPAHRSGQNCPADSFVGRAKK